MYIIENWLNGPRNFFVGKAVYKTVGGDKKLIDLLDKGKTPIAEELLLKAMQKLLQAPALPPVPKPMETADDFPKTTDPVLNSIREEWLKPYQDMNYKRHQLDQYKGNSPEMIAKRKPLAFEILELEQQCMRAWKKRDYYLQHGKLPDVADTKKELPTDPVELGKYISNLAKNIRRNKLLMKQHPDKPVYTQKYEQYKQEYIDATGTAYQEKN